MAKCNIIRNIKDPFNRYKMDEIKINIIKNNTHIINIKEIADQLNRSIIYIMKFFEINIGTGIRIDKKNKQYILNGKHTSKRLQELLDIFIETFVKCDTCENPETILNIYTNTKILKKRCLACGSEHKIQTGNKKIILFITNNKVEHKSVNYIIDGKLQSKYFETPDQMFLKDSLKEKKTSKKKKKIKQIFKAEPGKIAKFADCVNLNITEESYNQECKKAKQVNNLYDSDSDVEISSLGIPKNIDFEKMTDEEINKIFESDQENSDKLEETKKFEEIDNNDLSDLIDKI